MSHALLPALYLEHQGQSFIYHPAARANGSTGYQSYRLLRFGYIFLGGVGIKSKSRGWKAHQNLLVVFILTRTLSKQNSRDEQEFTPWKNSPQGSDSTKPARAQGTPGQCSEAQGGIDGMSRSWTQALLVPSSSEYFKILIK